MTKRVKRACLTWALLSWSEVPVVMVTENFQVGNYTLKVAKTVFPELLSSCSLCLFCVTVPESGYTLTVTLRGHLNLNKKGMVPYALPYFTKY